MSFFPPCILFIQQVGAIEYDFEMTSYNVSEDDGLVELILRIVSPLNVFCNISVNLTATDNEAGMLSALHVRTSIRTYLLWLSLFINAFCLQYTFRALQ